MRCDSRTINAAECPGWRDEVREHISPGSILDDFQSSGNSQSAIETLEIAGYCR
jgi:hypothetical protein